MFDIKDDKQNIIINLLRDDLSSEVVDKLRFELKSFSAKKQIGINLRHVKKARNAFFSFLKEYSDNQKISLYNMTADINLLLFLMNYNQYAQLYVNETDFKERKRNLIHRKFKICPS